MKKYLIFVLIISMFLSFPSYANTSDMYEISEVNKLLSELGCISGDSLNILSSAENITRGQFAKVIADVAKLDTTDNSLYDDVPSTYAYCTAVNAVSVRGIMKGDGSGRFNPEKELKEIDAVVTILRILGYDELAQHQGGYPTGYLNVIRNTKLNSGINSISLSENLTSDTLAILIKNMLDEKILDTSVVKTDGYSKQYSEKSFLSIYYGFEKVKGVVAGNTVTTLDNPVENAGIIINGRVLITGDKQFDAFLGYEAEGYYDTETSKLIYAIKTNKNKVTSILSEEIYTVSGRAIICEEDDGRQTKYVMPKDAYIIYNGRACSEYSYSLFDVLNGEINFIDNNNDGKTDIVSILSYETLVVNDVNSEENLIMFKYNGGTYDREMLKDTVFYKDGQISNITWINEYDALDILKSDTGEILEIHNSGNVKTMIPVSVEADDNEGYIIFSDGTCAYTCKNTASRFSDIALNEMYICSFNKFGKVIAMEKKESGLTAVLLGFGDRGSFEKETIAKFYTELDSLDTYKLAEKIIVNNEEKDIRKETDKNDVLMEFTAAKGKPVEIELNNKGELEKISIMTVAYDSGDKSVYVYGVAATNVITAGSDAQYLSQKAKAFYIPENYTGAEKDYFKVTSTGSVGSIYRPIVAYKKFESDLPEADALVFITGNSTTTMPDYDQPSIVEKVTSAYNSVEQTACSKVTYWYMGAKYSALLAKPELENILSAGDIAYLDIEDDGMIYGIKKFFDYSENTLIQEVTATRSKHRTQYGSLYQTYDNLYSVTTDVINSENYIPDYLEYHRYPNYGYVYDTTKNTVRKAWLSDFIGYTNDSDNYSKVFVFTTYMTEYMAVIYK